MEWAAVLALPTPEERVREAAKKISANEYSTREGREALATLNGDVRALSVQPGKMRQLLHPVHDITVTITGGELFQRNAVASELAALLNSLNVKVRDDDETVVVDDEEHEDHVRHVAHNATIYIKRSP